MKPIIVKEKTIIELYALIDEIPHSGEWWKVDSQETFRETGKKLLEYGLDVDDAISILEDTYFATCAEYGE